MQVKLSWKARLCALFSGTLTIKTAVKSADHQPPVTKDEETCRSAKQILRVLQQKGRFLDFLYQDIDRLSDTQIADGARVVHRGCQKALESYCKLAPVRLEPEGADITVEKDFDRSQINLTGNIDKQRVFHGKLIHKGWKIGEIKLPKLTQRANSNIVQPAEIEVI